MAVLSSSALPTSSLVLTAALSVLLAGTYNFIFYPIFLSPLAKIPAARWHARILPLYSYYVKYRKIENRVIHGLHKKHGSVFLLGPNELCVNCCEGLKTIYNGDFPKADWYFNRFSNFRTDNIFTTRDSKLHGQRKRLLSQAYSKSTVLSSTAIAETTLDIIFDHLFPILHDSSISKTPVNMHPLDYAYSIDSFTAFQLGARLGTNFVRDSDTRDWFLHHFFAPRPYTVFWEVEVPTLTSRLLSFGIRLVPKWCDQSRMAVENHFMDKYDQAAQIVTMVEDETKTKTKSTQEEKSDFDWPAIFAVAKDRYGRFGPSSFMTTVGTPASPSASSSSSKAPQPYHHRLQIASDMFDETVAAVETSGNTLTFLHYELARNPVIQSALRDELSTSIRLPPSKQALTQIPLKFFDALPLLDAVLIETLRLYPPVGGPEPRVTPGPGPSCISGFEGIPPGVRVQASAWSLHRNADIFPEPEAWRPGRWLEAGPQRLSLMRRWFWAFGSGARVCLGRHFAAVSIKLVLAAIYTSFEVELAGGDDGRGMVIVEQEDGYSGGPTGGELWLQFRKI